MFWQRKLIILHAEPTLPFWWPFYQIRMIKCIFISSNLQFCVRFCWNRENCKNSTKCNGYIHYAVFLRIPTILIFENMTMRTPIKSTVNLVGWKMACRFLNFTDFQNLHCHLGRLKHTLTVITRQKFNQWYFEGVLCCTCWKYSGKGQGKTSHE